MKCPHCGLENRPTAERCDCGYEFASKNVEQSYLDGADTDSDQIKRAFKKRFILQLSISVPAVVIILVTRALTSSEENSRLFWAIFIPVIVLAFFFSIRNWRCPACRNYLGRGYPKTCPKCGVQLR